MAFDPTLPVNNSLVSLAELRNQFNGLKTSPPPIRIYQCTHALKLLQFGRGYEMNIFTTDHPLDREEHPESWRALQRAGAFAACLAALVVLNTVYTRCLVNREPGFFPFLPGTPAEACSACRGVTSQTSLRSGPTSPFGLRSLYLRSFVGGFAPRCCIFPLR